METINEAPDVWQQLQEFRLGEPLAWFLEHAGGLPGKWSLRAADGDAAANAQPAATAAATARGDAAYGAGSESVQIFGLFGSRFFLFAVLIGFVISRIHVLVHRQRVRALGLAARVALYLPALLLLARALALACLALDARRARGEQRWMQGAVGAVAGMARRHGMDASGGALWASFATACVFDCVDVFVARLEGSPCAPYEYIGGLIERTSLYYFYGGSVRIQELALLNALEKLLLGSVLLVLPNGWRWRLIPTAAANLLMLHHFVFSMRSPSAPHAMYPFVQVLSMALLGVSLAIVLVTAAVHSLARIVDRLGFARHTPQPHRAVALYDRHGVFQGTAADDDEDDALLDLAPDVSMPIVPDLRRDFSVEILDLAGTCLQQCSNQIRATGLARPCGAIRLPRTTALDEYVDRVVGAADAGSACWREPPARRSRSGLSAFVEDEPSVVGQVPTNTADLIHVLRDTRANSVRRLSLGMWALIAALGHYALERKMGPLDPAFGASRRGAEKLGRLAAPSPESAAGSPSDDEDESDYDFICATSDTSDASDAELEPDGLVGETAALVGDILSGTPDEQPSDRLAAAVAFMAHSLIDSSSGSGPAVMTRSMYACQVARIGEPGAPLLGALSGLYQHAAVSAAVPAPFARGETESLAQLIQGRRSAVPRDDDSRSLCVVCWTNPRCVMLRPCRCLCLCNDCRAALVVRNFDHCPCCRRGVAGYSRVYAV